MGDPTAALVLRVWRSRETGELRARLLCASDPAAPFATWATCRGATEVLQAVSDWLTAWSDEQLPTTQAP